MRRAVMVGLLLPFIFGPAIAQNNQADAPPTPPAVSPTICYEVVPLPMGQPPGSPILINRCSGATWTLVRQTINNGQGKPAGFVYRWNPLSIENGEAILKEVSPYH
jgi:hypothetical protein